MKQLRYLSPLVLVALAACASHPVFPPGFRYAGAEEPMKLVEGPSVPPPANDIPERQRREWFDAQRPRMTEVRYVVSEDAERRPVRYERESCHDCWDGWYLPLSLSLGYWGGGHGHHGWGWGLGWNSGWRNGWCW